MKNCFLTKPCCTRTLKEWANCDKQTLKFINNTETSISFEIFHPEFVSISIRERKGKTTEWVLITDQQLSLPPRKHFELKVSLYLTKSLIDDLIEDVSKDDRTFSIDKQPSGAKIVSFSDAIQIQYSNDTKEEIPLNVKLNLPNFSSPSLDPNAEPLSCRQISFDFGCCFIGSEFTKQLEVVNKTSCGSLWKIEKVLKHGSGTDQYENDIQIMPEFGYLGRRCKIFN